MALRIGIIAPPWVPVPPAGYGGTEAVLDALARALAAADHEVLLFATGDSTCPVPTRWVHARAAWLDAGGTLAELHQVVGAYDALAGCDIVHDHTLVGPLYAARFPELPVVTTNHGPFDASAIAVYRAIAARVPVVAISQQQAASAAGVPIAAVIHHGVDVRQFPFGAGDGGYALFVGRMSPDKGVEAAIRTARAAGVPLLIAAKMREAAEMAYYRDRVQPQLGDDVEYVGEVAGVDKLELIAGATCLLNPIRWDEPFGLVMIEALACGTPVVTTRHGAAPEIVDHGQTGLLCDGADELVAGVRHASALDRSACRKAVAERFSAERMAARHVELYRRVVASWPAALPPAA